MNFGTCRHPPVSFLRFINMYKRVDSRNYSN